MPGEDSAPEGWGGMGEDPGADAGVAKAKRAGAAAGQSEEPAPVIRDKRKVDPVSGQPRTVTGDEPPVVQSMAGDEVLGQGELIVAREEIAVLTDHLKRVTAEYANYRKRVDRDRALAGLAGQAEVFTSLIAVLDDIEAARLAGELSGPFGAVATKLEETLAKFGLERYGAEGEAFDPAIHEALLHQASPEVDGPTIFMVLQPGYRVGERLLRAARVGVADKADDEPAGQAGSESTGETDGKDEEPTGKADNE